jgi:peptidyl-prolyl cis-trans isomerase B (cyclophilin B)
LAGYINYLIPVHKEHYSDLFMGDTLITMKTSKGDIALKLFKQEAPLTVANFLFLAKRKFYDGLKFHRVIDDFMIQGGDPMGTGEGDPTSKGLNEFEYQGKKVAYPFKDEFQSGKTFNKPGILAMANAGPNTNGSQFFITHVPTAWLNGLHTIFGEVVKGQNVVNAIRSGDKIIKIDINSE